MNSEIVEINFQGDDMILECVYNSTERSQVTLVRR